MATSKDYRISAIRMMCTLLVVVLHIFQQFEAVKPSIHVVTDWLNLGLVMFFCISAFLYSKRNRFDGVRWWFHRYKELILPSIIVGLTVLIVFCARGQLDADKIKCTLMSCTGFQVWSQPKWMFIELWFLSYILFCYATLSFVHKIPCNKGSDKVFWGVLILGSMLMQVLFLVLETVLKVELFSVGVLLRFYIPYFVFRRYDIEDDSLKKIMIWITMMTFSAVGLICIIRYTDIVALPAAIEELAFIYTQTLAGFTVFYWLYHFLKFVDKPFILLRFSDYYSYEIYLTHCLFIAYRSSVISAFNYSLVSVTFALALTILASVLLRFTVETVKKVI